MNLRFIKVQNNTPGREHCISIATDDTVQMQGEKPPTTAQHIGCTRNAPNMPGAHQEARKQARKGVLGAAPRHTSLGATQAKCPMEPAVVINKTDAPNSHWIMCKNGAQQPRVYRHTRTFLKKRSTPTDGKQKAQMK